MYWYCLRRLSEPAIALTYLVCIKACFPWILGHKGDFLPAKSSSFLSHKNSRFRIPGVSLLWEALMVTIRLLDDLNKTQWQLGDRYNLRTEGYFVAAQLCLSTTRISWHWEPLTKAIAVRLSSPDRTSTRGRNSLRHVRRHSPVPPLKRVQGLDHSMGF
jgi:hypothetical protein